MDDIPPRRDGKRDRHVTSRMSSHIRDEDLAGFRTRPVNFATKVSHGLDIAGRVVTRPRSSICVAKRLFVLTTACSVAFIGLISDAAAAMVRERVPVQVRIEQPTLHGNIVTIIGHAGPGSEVVVWDSIANIGPKQPGKPTWRRRQIVDRVRTDARG